MGNGGTFEPAGRGQAAEVRVRTALRALEAEHRQLALLALSQLEAAVKAQPALAQPVAAGLFQVLGGLQAPSWGYWRGLLDGIRNTRIRALRECASEVTTPLAESATLEGLFDTLERRVEPAAFRKISSLLDICKFTGRSATVAAVLGVPIRLRNFVAHQMPTQGSPWWQDAEAALEPLLELQESDVFELREYLNAELPSPWCIKREGGRFTYNGLGTDFSAHYAPADQEAAPVESPEGGGAVLQAIALLAAKPLKDERDIARWLRKLAPEELRGVVLGDFLVGRPVGVGGFATVHVARQLSTGRKVALKVLRDSVQTDDVARFQKDAEYLALFDHPNIARVLGSGEDTWMESKQSSLSGERWFEVLFRNGKPVKHWIALEWLDGETLEQVYRRFRDGPEPTIESEELKLRDELGLAAATPTGAETTPDQKTLIEWLAQSASALAAVHTAGLIHRDVKPSNLMVTSDGHVKLIDFGVARRQHALRTVLTAADQNPGTMAYKAPEQLGAMGAEQRVGPASDVYSLCASFYELFSRRRLFDWPEDAVRASQGRIEETSYRRREGKHRPPRVRVEHSGWGREIETLVMGGLEPEPNERPTAQQIRDDVERAKASKPIDYQPPGAWRRVQLAYRRHRTVANLVLVFVTVALTGVAFYVWSLSNERDLTELQRQRAVINEQEALRQEGIARERALQESTARSRAEQAEGRAREEQVRAEQSERYAKARLAALLLREAKGELALHRYDRALAYLAEAYDLDPENDAVRFLLPEVTDRCSASGTTFRGHSHVPHWAGFIPESELAFSQGVDNKLSTWSTENGVEQNSYAALPFGYMVFSDIDAEVADRVTGPDSRYAAIQGRDGTCKVIELKTGKETPIPSPAGCAYKVAIGPGGKALARVYTTSMDESLLRVDGLGSHTLSQAKVPGWPQVQFSPNGQRLVIWTQGEQGYFRLINADTGDVVVHVDGQKFTLKTISFSKDGARLCAAFSDGTLRLFSCDTGTLEESLRYSSSGSPDFLALSNDGSVIVCAATDMHMPFGGKISYRGKLTIFTGAPGQRLERRVFSSSYMLHVDITPTGDRCVTAGSDGSVLLWSVANGISTEVARHSDRVIFVAIEPEGKRILSCGADRMIRVSRAQSSYGPETLLSVLESLDRIQVGANGVVLALGHRFTDMNPGVPTAKLVDFSASSTQSVAEPHESGIGDACLTADGHFVFTCARFGGLALSMRIGGMQQEAVKFSAREGAPSLRCWPLFGGANVVIADAPAANEVAIQRQYGLSVWDASHSHTLCRLPLQHEVVFACQPALKGDIFLLDRAGRLSSTSLSQDGLSPPREIVPGVYTDVSPVFSAQGKFIALLLADGRLVLVSPRGQIQWSRPTRHDGIVGIEVSRDGKRVVVIESDDSTTLWDCERNVQLWSVHGSALRSTNGSQTLDSSLLQRRRERNALCLTSDDSLLMVISSDGTLSYVSMRDGFVLERTGGGVVDVHLGGADNSQYLVFGTSSGEVTRRQMRLETRSPDEVKRTISRLTHWRVEGIGLVESRPSISKEGERAQPATTQQPDPAEPKREAPRPSDPEKDPWIPD